MKGGDSQTSVVRSGVVHLSPDDPAQVEAVARLHTQLLPGSFAARFGHCFMTRFYFSKLVASDLIACDLYLHEGEYVGFTVYTKHPDTFVREGVRRHFPSLCLVTAVALASDPRRLAALPDLVRKNAALRKEESRGTGYWLTFGVLESHRRLRIDEHGTRISNALVQAMFDYFRNEGFTRIDGGVERENKSAVLFYHSCGFSIHDPGGGSAYEIRYDLDRR